VALTCHLVLAGPAPAILAELITPRFGDVTIRSDARRTVLRGQLADQPAVRALVNLLWDVGSDIRLLQITAAATPPVQVRT
jgi:hypothetical protein